MTDDPTRKEIEASAGPVHDDENDTEGHSMAALLAMNELGKRGARGRDPKTATDENLPALTKHFPNMRQEKRR